MPAQTLTDTADRPRRVPPASPWGLLGVSWFALPALALPAVWLGIVGTQTYELKQQGGARMPPEGPYLTGFTLGGMVAVTLVALVVAAMVYLATLRRRMVWPTAAFLLAAGVTSGFIITKVNHRNTALAKHAESVRALREFDRQLTEKHRAELESDGAIAIHPEDIHHSVELLESRAATETDPTTATILRVTTSLTREIAELNTAYSNALQPYLQAGGVAPATIKSEDDILVRIDSIEQSQPINRRLIEAITTYESRAKAMLSEAGIDGNKLPSILRGMREGLNADLLLTVRNSEDRFMLASREQLSILLDTYGLWEIGESGILFDESVDKEYTARFNAAHAEIQAAAAAETAAQRELVSNREQTASSP